MKIGLIARCDTARGLAIQAKNFYDNMPVERVLCVRMPKPDTVERPEWYADRVDVAYEPLNHLLDEETVRGWLDGLDVVFAVETPHDWRIPTWCKEQGVRLVIQGNPEFVRHGLKSYDLPHPDQWWWPTSWRLDQLPEGIVMPVPMDLCLTARSDDPRLHVLHVVGKRAYADRNGTELLVQAMRMVTANIKLTIHSIDGGVAEFTHNRHVEFNYQLDPVEDQWSMYDDQDVLILPRRYGGLSLPALEAAAAGLVVSMTDCPPNRDMAALMIPSTLGTRLDLACGQVQAHDARPNQLAEQIAFLDTAWKTKRSFGVLRVTQRNMVLSWAAGRALYLQAFEKLL